MKGYEIDTDKLASMSVAPFEVCAVAMANGDSLEIIQGKRARMIHAASPMVLICDRFTGSTCTGIRQTLLLPSGDPDGWGQCYIPPNRKARQWAKAHNYSRITIRGGIPPLTIDGTVAVPDFVMSGTSWYIVNGLELSKQMGWDE